jgi:surface polysaccharide O-acyltransferase-like enzyme
MTEVTKRKKRASGIELLRILAMIAIIAHHFSTHVNWGEVTQLNSYWITIFGSFGRIGVGIFFIITGYFLARQKNYNWKKIFNVLRPTWFYSLLFLGIFTLLKDGRIFLSFPLNEHMQKSLFPIISNSYWFISTYVAVSLLSPYLKKMLDALADKDLLKIIAIFFGCSFCAQLFNAFLSDTSNAIMKISVGIFYVIVGYCINRYEQKIKSNSWCFVGILLSLILIAVAPIINHVAFGFGYHYPKDLFTDVFAPATIIFSVSAFILFSRFKFSNSIINYIASLTFGIYLIHENLFVASTLWNTDKIFNITSHGLDGVFKFALYSIGIVLIIFVVCAVIESIRKLSVKFISYICNFENIANKKEEA